MKLPNNPTFGFEEEVFVSDMETGALAEIPPACFAELNKELGEAIQREYKQPVLEMVTTSKPIDPRFLINEAVANRFEADQVLKKFGLRILPLATHPTAKAFEVPAREGQRYRDIEKKKGDAVRQLLINGVHFHIGTYTDGNERWVAMPNLLQLAPLHLAVTACSPWFNGRDTGWASWRLAVLGTLASTLPMMPASAEEFSRQSALVKAAGGPSDASEYWGLLRPGAGKPTIEFRAADTTPRLDAHAGLAALSAAAAYTVRIGKMPMIKAAPRMEPYFFDSNVRAASTNGIDATLIDPYDQEPKSVLEFAKAWVRRCRHAIADLNYSSAIGEMIEVLSGMEVAGSAAAQLRAIIDRATTAAKANGLSETDATNKGVLTGIRWAWRDAQGSPAISLLTRLQKKAA